MKFIMCFFFFFSFKSNFFLYNYLVLAFSLVASSRSCSLVAVPGLIAVASLVAEHRLWSAGSVVVVHGLSCSAHVRSSWMRD